MIMTCTLFMWYLRTDLVKNGDKMNVGLGTMGGVCYTDRKCTVNQDSGLDTAYTIVHELGHAYGIYNMLSSLILFV